MNADVTPTVRTWLAETAAQVADPVSIHAAVAAAVHGMPQERHRGRAPFPQRLSRHSAWIPGVVATAIAFVLFGGFLLNAGLRTDSPAASPLAALGSSSSGRPEPTSTSSTAPSLGPHDIPRAHLASYPQYRVEFQARLMLPGQVETASAEVCLESGCVPAGMARWVVDEEQYRDLIEPRRGARVQITAQPEPGEMDIRVKGRWARGPDGKYIWGAYATSVEVRPFPGESTRESRRRSGGPSLAFPDEQVLGLGQDVVLTGWLCPRDGSDGYGADGRPGTSDDSCEVSPIASAYPLPGSGVSIVGTFGPSVLVHVDSFVDLGGDVNAVGVFLEYDRAPGMDLEIPYLYVRNEPWQAPLLGDVDADGRVDADDRAMLDGALATAEGGAIPNGSPAFVEALDLNADRSIDGVDLDILEALLG